MTKAATGCNQWRPCESVEWPALVVGLGPAAEVRDRPRLSPF
jgi:hypothetical protein